MPNEYLGQPKRYYINLSTFKPSGKYYNSGRDIDLGIHVTTPFKLFAKYKTEIYEDLDKFTNLPENAIVTNKLSVLIQLMDDSTNPICFQELVVCLT